MTIQEIKKRTEELGERQWDDSAIRIRYEKLAKEGIPRKTLSKEEYLANKSQILERVQQRAEEYNYILKNCAQGTALALLEEFGLGNMDIIKALTPFPGIGGTGGICGGITGGLITFGLYFGSNNLLDFETAGTTIMHAQMFMASFEGEVGSLYCAKIQETIFGRNMDPGACPENMEAFAAAKGFEKCGTAPGIGARLAAEFIIDGMKA
ncbi:MAG: C-GCAxxG-C-C family protein [Deltaproteobacteria bacterium]|nr:C-GCAxxG-C-C family protein [Deltaproteobacteria bacterium]